MTNFSSGGRVGARWDEHEEKWPLQSKVREEQGLRGFVTSIPKARVLPK